MGRVDGCLPAFQHVPETQGTRNPMNGALNITPKTAAAVSAGGVSVAIVSIAGWVLGFWHITIPPEVAAGFATLFSGAGAYFAPRSHPPEPK